MYVTFSNVKSCRYGEEHAVKVAKEELTLECDYVYERESQQRMKAEPSLSITHSPSQLTGAGFTEDEHVIFHQWCTR